MKKVLRLAFVLFAVALLSVPVQAQNALQGTDLFESLSTWNWASDSSWKAQGTLTGATGTLDAAYALRPYDARSDSNGKTYHYIIGSGSRTSFIQTLPINSEGYNRISMQAFATNVSATGTSATAVISPNVIGSAYNVYGSCYSADYITGASLSVPHNNYGVHRAAFNGLWAKIPIEPLSIISGEAVYATTVVSADGISGPTGTIATSLIPSTMRHSFKPDSITSGGIYHYDTGGSIARLCVSVSRVAAATLTYATDHIIIRLNK